jgi:hypothetical protein
MLFVSILDSLKHRKHAIKEASALTDTIIGKVLIRHEAVISKEDIKQLSYKTLRLFDETAAAVYAALQDTKKD